MNKQDASGLKEAGKPKFFYGYYVVLSCFIMMVVWWGTYYSFGVLFESLLVEFGWTRAMTAGAFSVLLALGGSGADAAAGMIVVQFLANGILQQLVQPFAMGAALGIHPLAVLIVTIAGGAIFGAIGLILAAPLVSAAVRISADLARARAEEEAQAGGAPDAEPPPGAEPAPAPG